MATSCGRPVGERTTTFASRTGGDQTLAPGAIDGGAHMTLVKSRSSSAKDVGSAGFAETAIEERRHPYGDARRPPTLYAANTAEKDGVVETTAKLGDAIGKSGDRIHAKRITLGNDNAPALTAGALLPPEAPVARIRSYLSS